MNIKSNLLHNFIVFALTLLFLFGMFAVMLTGAGAYSSITSVMDSAYSVHTGVGYISAKIRAYDTSGSVELGNLEGTDALLLFENIEGYDYVTYIYCADGYLYELFCEVDSGLGVEDGSPLLPMDSLELKKLTPSLIIITCIVGDNFTELYTSTRSTGGGGL